MALAASRVAGRLRSAALRKLFRDQAPAGLAVLQAASAYHVATYPIQPPKESYEFLGGSSEPKPSVRDAVGSVAARLFGQEAVPLDFNTPMTLDSALEESEQARIITEAQPPFRIVHANHAWEELCGFSAQEVQDHPGLSFLQGSGTDPLTIRKINSAVREGGRVRVVLMNYKKDGTPFFNKLQVSPLRSNMGTVTHMLGILKEVQGAS